jgi:Ribbon-helix-helix domain
MSRKKISTTIYVTPEQNELLRLLHDRTKVPVAVYIREGIDLVLRQYAHMLPGQLTLTSERDVLVAEPTTPSASAAASASAATVLHERHARAGKG